jgi:hypothetical protein
VQRIREGELDILAPHGRCTKVQNLMGRIWMWEVIDAAATPSRRSCAFIGLKPQGAPQLFVRPAFSTAADCPNGHPALR